MDKTKDALAGEDNPSLVVIDDVAYNAAELPANILGLLDDLLKLNQELEDLQRKIRITNAAQQAYYDTIKATIKQEKVKPYNK
jgi:hypothetical protein